MGAEAGMGKAEEAADDDNALAEEGEELFPRSHRCGLCVLLMLLRVAAHYDIGALAALYGESGPGSMAEEMSLSSTEQGLLISLSYAGIITGCVVSGPLLQLMNAKEMLQASLLLMAAGVAAFAFAPNETLLQAARPVVGLGQAFLTVLYPVWVDEYAPPSSAAGYMAALQAGGPLGTVAGYLTSGFLTENTELSWRWCFFIQGLLLVPFMLFFCVIPSRYVDLGPGGPDSARWANLSAGVKSVLADPLVWGATLTLSSLYFVVIGLQTWVTGYVRSPASSVFAPPNAVVASFGFTAATAPVSGIILGGTFLARVGGRDFLSRSARVGLGLGLLAAGCAYGSIFVTSFTAFMLLVWLLLFFGGAMVPGLMSTVVVAVAKENRALVSAFAAVMYNSLGYALGPLACGIVADQFRDRDEGIVWGFRVVLGWSGVALLLQLSVVYFASNRCVNLTPKGGKYREEQGAALPAPVESV